MTVRVVTQQEKNFITCKVIDLLHEENIFYYFPSNKLKFIKQTMCAVGKAENKRAGNMMQILKNKPHPDGT